MNGHVTQPNQFSYLHLNTLKIQKHFDTYLNSLIHCDLTQYVALLQEICTDEPLLCINSPLEIKDKLESYKPIYLYHALQKKAVELFDDLYIQLPKRKSRFWERMFCNVTEKDYDRIIEKRNHLDMLLCIAGNNQLQHAETYQKIIQEIDIELYYCREIVDKIFFNSEVNKSNSTFIKKTLQKKEKYFKKKNALYMQCAIHATVQKIKQYEKSKVFLDEFLVSQRQVNSDLETLIHLATITKKNTPTSNVPIENKAYEAGKQLVRQEHFFGFAKYITLSLEHQQRSKELERANDTTHTCSTS